MPTYVYEACDCFDEDLFELNVPISDRDTQECAKCGTVWGRKIVFTGLTWAPTAGGMR